VSGPSRRLLTAARAAASQGWPVFPLQPYGKRPAIRDWPNRATCDPAQLVEWWDRAAYNVGVSCGSAGLLVVDIDRRPATEQRPAAVLAGAQLLAVLAGRAGAADPRETYTVATPRGEHRYFTVPAIGSHLSAAAGENYRERVLLWGRTTAGALGPGLDTRADGGYVAAAGSVRRIDGHRRYYRIGRLSPVVPAPQWLLEALTPPPAPGLNHHLIAAPDVYTRAVLAREASGVRAAEPGIRNSCLFGAAVRLGQLAAAGLISENDVSAALLHAADRHVGVDGFTAAEAARAIGNGLAYGRRRPRRLPSVDR
jgi:hypothetical protein